MRWLVIVAFFIRAVAGFIWPTQPNNAGGTSVSYEATMALPSGYNGEYIPLTCGWHAGACDTPGEDGPALDWAPTSTYVVRFRGWFYTAGAGWDYRLQGYIVTESGGSGVCDVTRVNVQELYSATYRYRMRYVHTTKIGSTFLIPTSYNNEWTSTTVAYMSNDAGCPWFGYHVHDEWVSLAVQSFAKATYYPYGDYCIPSPCYTYQNDNNWTRWGQWEEGS